MIYFLLITIILLLMVSYFIFDKDIYSPSVILCAVYIFSTVCAIYNIDLWAINLHLNTYVIIISGISIFILASFVIHCFFSMEKRNNVKNTKLDSLYENTASQLIYIQRGKTYFAILFSVAVAAIYIYSVRKVSFSLGASNDITDMLNTYRMNASYGSDASLPFIVNQLFKILKSMAYVFLYIFINNVIFEKKITHNLVYILPTIIFIFASFYGASRTEFLHIFLAALTIYYVLWNRKNFWKIKVNAKYIKICCVSLLLFFAFFSFIRPFVGRLNESDPVYYITSYAGGSIQLFDLYLQNPLPPSNIWGKEVFGALNQDISKFGIGSTYIRHLEFRYSNGILLGNIYTAFRCYIQDFGIIGMISLQTILACFYTGWYEKLKESCPKRYADFNLLAYSFLIGPIFLHSIQDIFFSGYICLNTLVMLLLLKISYSFFIEVKIVYCKSIYYEKKHNYINGKGDKM